MGSDSDMETMQKCIKTLDSFGIERTVHIISAHRTPDVAVSFAKEAAAKGYGVIIAGAGKAAHLAGFIAANTVLPVIGIPIKSSTLDGLDSLLSIVQMPSGVPVATVAIDGAQNAALLAIQMLALSDNELTEKLLNYKENMRLEVIKKNQNINI